jgi:hypothetical protein
VNALARGQPRPLPRTLVAGPSDKPMPPSLFDALGPAHTIQKAEREAPVIRSHLRSRTEDDAIIPASVPAIHAAA